jgi:AraC-like DNA-binding protein
MDNHASQIDPRPSFKEQLAIPEVCGGTIWPHHGNAYFHPRHRHDGLEFNLVVSGRGHYEVDGKRYVLGVGSLLWLYPGQNHHAEERTPDFEMWIVVLMADLITRTCTAGPAAALREPAPMGEPCRVIDWRDTRRLDQELARIRQSDSVDLRKAGLAYSLLDAWEAFLSSTSSPGDSVVGPEVQATMRLLAQDPAMSRETLSERVGLSPAALSRQFREQLGVTLVTYRQRLRLEHFVELACDGRYTLLDACYRAGFGSYAQCHRVFQESMGCSPREYLTKIQRRQGAQAQSQALERP